jgi:hypothetical protein
VSIVGTVLRGVARRLPARQRSVSAEVVRYWPEMHDSASIGRLRYALLCLVATAIMGIVFMVIGFKFIKSRQELQLQHSAEADAMAADAGGGRAVLDLSSLPGAEESSMHVRKSALANSGVLKMKAAGLSDELIVQRIQMSRGDYRLEPDDLSQLKRAGLSDAVISAMMTAATR